MHKQVRALPPMTTLINVLVSSVCNYVLLSSLVVVMQIAVKSINILPLLSKPYIKNVTAKSNVWGLKTKF